MTSPMPAFVLLSLLLGPPRLSHAVSAPADTAPLEFHGFRAGARLDEIQALVRSLDGGRLKCDRAKVDRHVTECRAVLTDPELGGAVDLWISAIDSVAGVITISGGVAADQLDRWRRTIERRYGRVDAQVQGSQWMMQWVRRGRMLRLTWRIEGGQKVASVSLVDGRVLDAWGGGRRESH
jgi:hypothetical protein